jgi:hypothetical protein
MTTETNTESRSDELIIEMMAELDAGTIGELAPTPGPGDDERILNRALEQDGEKLEVPMVTASHTNAGYYYMYFIPTGERRTTNKNMLPDQLKKTLEDGSPAFSLRPIAHPKVGSAQKLKCKLHPTDPNRAYYDTLGFSICMKANLTSPYQVLRHMSHRHKDESANIEEERQARERREDRETQQRLYELYGAIAKANGTSVAASLGGAAAPKRRRKVKKQAQE